MIKKIIIFLLLALIAGEVFVRLLVPKYMWELRDVTSDWQVDASLGWVNKPGLNIKQRLADGTVDVFRTNADGIFPAETKREKSPQVIRIMFFGDSIVLGRSLPQDKTITAALERILRAKNIAAEVINAGVEGYSTDQELIYMQRLIPLYKPDIVVCGVCQNDFEGITARQIYGLNKPLFVLNSSGGLVKAPGDIKNNRIKIFGHGPRKWVQFSALYRFLKIKSLIMRSNFDRLLDQNLTGLTESYYYNQTSFGYINFELFAALLKNMKKVSSDNNAVFLFYLHPALYEVWEPFIRETIEKISIPPAQYDRYIIEHSLEKIAEGNALNFCPSIDYFQENQARGPFHLLKGDPHCNESGYRLSAERIAQYMLDSGLLE